MLLFLPVGRSESNQRNHADERKESDQNDKKKCISARSLNENLNKKKTHTALGVSIGMNEDLVAGSKRQDGCMENGPSREYEIFY